MKFHILPTTLLLALVLTQSSCRNFRKKENVNAPRAGMPNGAVQGQNQAQVNRPPQQNTQRNTQKPRTTQTSSKPNPYSNPQRGLRNATVNVPRVIGPGSATTYSRVSGVPGKYIAITFDDGPHPTNTPRLLDMLRQRGIKATFYVVGTNSKSYPSILRRMIREGHEIGNHTYAHENLNNISRTAAQSTIARSSEEIFRATGVRPKTLRPPYGAFRSELRTWAKGEFGYPTILWSVDPRDWKDRNASIVTRRLIDGATPGAILLAHDIHKSTIDAMPNTLDGLLQRGYKFVTVSQLINLGGRGSAQAPPQQFVPSPYDLAHQRQHEMEHRTQMAPNSGYQVPYVQSTPNSPQPRNANPSWNRSPFRMSWQPQ